LKNNQNLKIQEMKLAIVETSKHRYVNYPTHRMQIQT